MLDGGLVFSGLTGLTVMMIDCLCAVYVYKYNYVNEMRVVQGIMELCISHVQVF